MSDSPTHWFVPGSRELREYLLWRTKQKDTTLGVEHWIAEVKATGRARRVNGAIGVAVVIPNQERNPE